MTSGGCGVPFNGGKPQGFTVDKPGWQNGDWLEWGDHKERHRYLGVDSHGFHWLEARDSGKSRGWTDDAMRLYARRLTDCTGWDWVEPKPEVWRAPLEQPEHPDKGKRCRWRNESGETVYGVYDGQTHDRKHIVTPFKSDETYAAKTQVLVLES